MAFPPLVSFKVLILLSILSSFQLPAAFSVQFEVGGAKGWAIPKSKDADQMYNQWASQNRFKVNDTIHFKYDKDSVLVVTEPEYEKCKSAHPLYYSNNGDTTIRFERPGLFYFISGVSGHCERGEKMIIKVLELVSPPLPANSTMSDSSDPKSAAKTISVSSVGTVVALASFILAALEFTLY